MRQVQSYTFQYIPDDNYGNYHPETNTFTYTVLVKSGDKQYGAVIRI